MVAIVRRNSGLIYRQSGSIIRASAASLAAYRLCCCGNVPCNCDAICVAPSWRVLMQQPGSDGTCSGAPGGICYTSATYTGSMIEYVAGDPEFAPDPQPASVPIARYWRAETSMVCAVPTNPLIEFCCVDTDSKQYIRINGVSWRQVGDSPCTDQYWNCVSVASGEFAPDFAGGCCGVASVEIYCGTAPAVPNCDLVGTGPQS